MDTMTKGEIIGLLRSATHQAHTQANNTRHKTTEDNRRHKTTEDNNKTQDKTRQDKKQQNRESDTQGQANSKTRANKKYGIGLQHTTHIIRALRCVAGGTSVRSICMRVCCCYVYVVFCFVLLFRFVMCVYVCVCVCLSVCRSLSVSVSLPSMCHLDKLLIHIIEN